MSVCFIQNMADDTRSLSSLREANLVLLSRLHVAQNTIWKNVSALKSTAESSNGDEPMKSVEYSAYGADRTPVSTLRRRGLAELSTKSTRSPFVKPLGASEIRFSTPRSCYGKENKSEGIESERLNSILRTPHGMKSRRKNETPEHINHVTFEPSVIAAVVTNKNNQSLLGYDWIAGMLDNGSYLSGKNDSFFEELQEFRRVNRSECSGATFVQKLSKSPLVNNLSQGKQDEKCHKCSDTYVVDDRLFAVPIHGSESYCALCKSKKPSEYETEGSYVRVSVPRSTLQSPHRVKPHRRKSFDPTDTVSLSKHCLLGWESSRPTVFPTQSSLDLRADTGLSKLNALNWSASSLKGTGVELPRRVQSLSSELQRVHRKQYETELTYT